MKRIGTETIEVKSISTGDRLRAVDMARAEMLAENLRQTGHLRQPVEVRRLTGGGYTLIAGAHRLVAVQMVGWETVEVILWDCNADEARLLEIDENLVRHELNPLDRAVFLSERKRIYEGLYPETVAGVAGGKARQGSATEIISFAKDTAERCGITERAVRLAVSIATKLTPEVRARIAGTDLVKKQAELLTLAKLAPAEQMAAVNLVLGGTAKSVRVAADMVQGRNAVEADPAAAALQKLLTAWQHAPVGARRAFIEHLRTSGQLGQIQALPAEQDDQEQAA